MNYNDILDYLYHKLPFYQRIGKAAYKENLDNSILLDNHFGNPHRKFKSIHIAGTNGKGSVSHMLASILQTAGFKVGLYTSPHLKDFRERIKINGKVIPKKEVVSFITENFQLFDEMQPSFFEITVAMAFYYFAKENVDYAVIEVGLGGRLDSTNIITPEVSIITNISLDHNELLGNSKFLIANEKAGIIKESVPVIIGQSDEEIDSVFLNIAKSKNSEIYFADKIYYTEYSLLSTDSKQVLQIKRSKKIEYPSLKIDLLGNYQRLNIIPVLKTVDILNKKGIKIQQNVIYKGLENVVRNTGLHGRWEVLGTNPRIVCDTAHNEDGIKLVLNQIINIPFKELHVILGFVNDKNLDSILPLFPKEAIYYFTKANIPRALNENELQKMAKKYGLNGEPFIKVTEAFVAAKNNSNPDDFIFIGGSTFVVAELIKI